MTATVVYRVRPGNPAAHRYTVSCLIEAPAADGQLFSLPAWIPGSYLIRDYARHVLTVRARADGEPVPVAKLDKHTWRVAPCDGPLEFEAEVHAEDGSVRGAFLDARSGFFNGVALLFRVHGRERSRCVLHLEPPDGAAEGWQVATSMRRLSGAEYEFGAFVADGWEDLVDHPVLMGQLDVISFEAGGIPHALVIEGRHDADRDRLAHDLVQLCEWHLEFWGRPADLDRYVFLLRLGHRGMGGLEHRFSSALAADRDSLPPPGGLPAEAAYRRFLGLVSHEYFHLWLVKRIRPMELVSADPGREAYTRQLWIFEGITSYYDDLALLRAGLISREEWFELMGRTLTRVYRSTGRRRQTLEEASFDAWIKFYRPDASSPDNTVSYYAKGALVALALDLELRLRSNGEVSLDQVLHRLWAHASAAGGPGLAEGAFERLAEDMAGCDLGEFFAQALRGTRDLPLGILLARFGVRLQMRPSEGRSDAGGKPSARSPAPAFWLGLDAAAAQGGVARVTRVHDGGPAQLAGLRTGDELVAVDGRRLTLELQERVLGGLAAKRPVRLHLFREGELLDYELMPAAAPLDTCWISDDAEAEPAARERRAAWIGA